MWRLDNIKNRRLRLFQHEDFDNYKFEEIPLNRDLFLIDECYLHQYENAMLKVFDGKKYQHVGKVGYITGGAITENTIELSWYPNVYDRFHEVTITLPKSQFITCVGSEKYDEKPRVFVKSTWLENLYLRSYSIFALIDAVNVKIALERGDITRDKLITLRNEIDTLSAKYPEISFISFADSILLKSNWSVEYFKSNSQCDYQPEVFIQLASEINTIYQTTLGLSTYAVIAQGSNEYYDDPLLHISESMNHISLNSLGIPFAQLMEIEQAARKAIKEKKHPAAELYMDEKYYHSLKYKRGFEKNTGVSNMYQTKMMGKSCRYYYSSLSNILSNLDNSVA